MPRLSLQCFREEDRRRQLRAWLHFTRLLSQANFEQKLSRCPPDADVVTHQVLSFPWH